MGLKEHNEVLKQLKLVTNEKNQCTTERNQWRLEKNQCARDLKECKRTHQDTPPPYYPYGPRQNVPMSTVLNGGCQQCYSERYDKKYTVNQFQNIKEDRLCTGSFLMLGCRHRSSNTITLLAAAPKDDVLKITDTQYGVGRGHVLNGSKWYRMVQAGHLTSNFNGKLGWGFADQYDPIRLAPCDYGETRGGSKRLCFHLENSGYRCGSSIRLYNDNQWEKLIFSKKEVD